MKKILEASICLIITTGIICGQELVGIDIDYEVLGPNGGMLRLQPQEQQ